jgi:hypothetical protein
MINNVLPFVKDFVEDLYKELIRLSPTAGLSKIKMVARLLYFVNCY